MASRPTAEEISRFESRGSAALWFAVLGGPLAWVIHLVVNYALEEWFACSTSALEPGTVLGVPVHTFSVAVNTAALALALASLVVAVVCLRRVRDGNEVAERARWMAWAGVVEGILFSAVIALGYAPVIILGTCEVTP